MPDYIQSRRRRHGRCQLGARCRRHGPAEESKLEPRNIQSRRQTGSLFQTFYLRHVFPSRAILPDTRISDDRISYGEIRGAANWSPRNSDGTYRGMKPASFGLILSRNTMSVRIGNRALQCHSIRPTTGGLSRKYFPHPGPLSGHVGSVPSGHCHAYGVSNGGVRPTPVSSSTMLRIPRASRASPSPRASAPSIPSGRRT